MAKIADPSPLVSVVTPVYNGEKYLAECIESVLAQTYQNWEYVIVNNCSKDRTPEIAQDYARRDARIRVHNNQEFLPVTSNWNHALRQISPESKYCKVVHADDWLYPDCITQMVRLAEANPQVGIVGAYRLLVRPSGVKVGCNELPYPSHVVSGWELCRLTLRGDLHVFGTPTSLLIRSSIIRSRGSFYNDLNRIDPDLEACYDVLQNTDFGFVHQILTCTRMHDTSVTSTFVNRFSAMTPGRITLLAKYGPIYLSKEEYEHRLKEQIEEYYKLLGYSVFHLRGKEFWDYHRNVFKGLGHDLSLVKLAKASVLRVIEALFNPKETVEKIISRMVRGELNLGLHR